MHRRRLLHLAVPDGCAALWEETRLQHSRQRRCHAAASGKEDAKLAACSVCLRQKLGPLTALRTPRALPMSRFFVAAPAMSATESSVSPQATLWPASGCTLLHLLVLESARAPLTTMFLFRPTRSNEAAHSDGAKFSQSPDYHQNVAQARLINELWLLRYMVYSLRVWLSQILAATTHQLGILARRH